MMSGPGVGAQIDWLSVSNTGAPCDHTCVAACTQLAVTQGGAPVVIVGNWQPVMR
jgi:hypothetical protein